MVKSEEAGVGAPRGNAFRFNLAGLIVYSATLVGVAAFAGSRFGGRTAAAGAGGPFQGASETATAADLARETAPGDDVSSRVGPWGELLVRDIEIERPRELVAAETADTPPETWTFRAAPPADVRSLLVANGLPEDDAARALAPDHVRLAGSDTIVEPGDDFLLSLAQDKRRRLYEALHGRGVSAHIDSPYIFPGATIDALYEDKHLAPDDVRVLRKLVYPVADATELSDFETLLRAIPTPERRVEMARALSRQSAVLARICIRRDTDVDKIVGYWGGMENVHANDVRPLLESLKAEPHGGTMSLVYLLPPFAREHLYTFPIRKPGDPGMDCHWTTFNFSRMPPDDRFDDPAYTARYIDENYYSIDAPGLYGDIVLLVDQQPKIQHSAVFLADDLVFTKYGLNDRQAWMIVHVRDMLAAYPHMKAVYARRRSR
jgi:hypothetical protein